MEPAQVWTLGKVKGHGPEIRGHLTPETIFEQRGHVMTPEPLPLAE